MHSSWICEGAVKPSEVHASHRAGRRPSEAKVAVDLVSVVSMPSAGKRVALSLRCADEGATSAEALEVDATGAGDGLREAALLPAL